MYSRILKQNLRHFSFLNFSQTLSSIQQTSSILKKTELLSEYICTLNQKDRQQTRKLFDFVHKKVSTGISDRLLISNSYKILGLNETGEEQIFAQGLQKEAKKNKDTVQVIEKLIHEDKPSSNVQIQKINQILYNLPTITGKNSVQQKIKEISKILNQLSFVQCRFFLRILTKDMKIGMKIKLVEKSFEEASKFNNMSSLSINPRTFQAMLARPMRDIEEFQKFCAKKEGKIIADVKYDGQRTLISYEKGKSVVLISRNGKEQNEKYYKIAEQVQQILESQKDLKSITLDAEIIAIDRQTRQPLPFQVLLTKRRKIDSTLAPNDDENSEQIIQVFDIIELNGKSLYETPLVQRKQLIFEKGIIRKGQFQTFKYPDERQKLMGYFHQIVKRKYEGLILKGTGDHYYTNGTRIHWGKLKKGFRQKKQDKGQIDLDLVLMGADYGSGKKARFFSSFLMGVKFGTKIIPISKVGTGFTEDDLEMLTEQLQKKAVNVPDKSYEIPKNIKMDKWFNPQIVAEIDCQQFSRSPLYELGYKQNHGGISLRFPVFKRLRDDKNIEQATDSKTVLEQMAKQEEETLQRMKARRLRMESKVQQPMA